MAENDNSRISVASYRREGCEKSASEQHVVGDLITTPVGFYVAK